MLPHLLALVALAAVLISCSGEREWRDPNRVLMRQPASEDSPEQTAVQESTQELDDEHAASATEESRTSARPESTRSVAAEGRDETSAASEPRAAGTAIDAAAASSEPALDHATATHPVSPNAALDPHALREALRPLTVDARLMLSAVSVSAGRTPQSLRPRFSAAVPSYVAVVPHDQSRVTLQALPSRPEQAVISYHWVDGSAIPDLDLAEPGLQIDLPVSGPALVEIAVVHGTQSRGYRIQLVRAGSPGGAAPCADTAEGDGESRGRPFEISDGRLLVPSTPKHYFVLYETPAEAGTELPVAIVIGQAGTTLLAHSRSGPAAERYRVERYPVDDPADIDSDCIDDLTELLDRTSLNPLNPAAPIDRVHGVVAVPDQAAFDELSYRKENAPEDFAYLKFVLLDLDTERPRIYLLNSREHRYHVTFREAVGLEPSGAGMLSGTVVQHPGRVARNGQAADFHFEFWPYTQYRFEVVARARSVLAASMPPLAGRLAYYVPPVARQAQAAEAERYRASRLGVVFDENIAPADGFAALNPARASASCA